MFLVLFRCWCYCFCKCCEGYSVSHKGGDFICLDFKIKPQHKLHFRVLPRQSLLHFWQRIILLRSFASLFDELIWKTFCWCIFSDLGKFTYHLLGFSVIWRVSYEKIFPYKHNLSLSYVTSRVQISLVRVRRNFIYSKYSVLLTSWKCANVLKRVNIIISKQ